MPSKGARDTVGKISSIREVCTSTKAFMVDYLVAIGVL